MIMTPTQPSAEQIQQAREDLSDCQAVFCVCGRMATGLHESNCSKFKAKALSMAKKQAIKDQAYAKGYQDGLNHVVNKS
jgi:hypothetical protein